MTNSTKIKNAIDFTTTSFGNVDKIIEEGQ